MRESKFLRAAAFALIVLGAALVIIFAPPAPSRGAPLSTTVHDTAPALRLRGLDGEEHGLEDWRGQVLLLNFWASWCAPCQAEIPLLVRWQAQQGAHGLQVIGVGIDNVRRLRNVQRSLNINYPVLVADPERSEDLLPQWGDTRRIVPYSVVIDRSGQIVHRQLGELDEVTFEDVIRPLLYSAQPAGVDTGGGFVRTRQD